MDDYKIFLILLFILIAILIVSIVYFGAIGISAFVRWVCLNSRC